MNKVAEFLGQVKTEMSKIEWPSYHEFIGSTLVTLILVLFFMVFIGVADKGLAFIAKSIFMYSSL